MRRIDWVKAELENWALWAERSRCGGLGFASQSVLLSEVVDRTREVPLPVDEVSASVTDQAVASLRPDTPHLYETLRLYYLSGVGIKGAAAHMGRAESTVKANLAQADAKLSVWFNDRKARHEAMRKQMQIRRNSFTT